MAATFLTAQEALHALEMASRSGLPPEIVALKDQIQGEIKAAEIAESITGEIDEKRLLEIVKMKLKLDGLFADWIRSET